MAKQLGQLLQEQQEPFTLEIYLLERGYLIKKSNLTRNFRSGSGNSLKSLKSSVSYSYSYGFKNKRKKVIPSCSKVVRTVFNKLISFNNNPQQPVDQTISVTTQSSLENNAEEERFSSASSTTVFNSCSESDTDSFQKEQVVTDGKSQWKCMVDKQQLSPISVLEQTLSDQDSQSCNKKQRNKARTKEEEKKSVNTIFLTSFCNLLEQSSPINHNDLSSDYTKMKMVLQETKKLLFDCVREVIENHKWKDRRQQQSKEFLGAEEIGRLLHENILTWSKHSTSGTNTTQLHKLASVEEWNNFEEQRKEIAMVIGDVVSEDIIDEFVTDLCHTQNSSTND